MTRMNKEEIIERISAFDKDPGWYQNIDLGNGIQTKSRQVWGEEIDHPRKRWGYIQGSVPLDMSGMKVLDIGCNAGFIAFEAKKRGASVVCGIDHNIKYINQAKFCAEVLELDIDFRVLRVDDLESLGISFDFVFFVGTLYHCHHIGLAMDSVAKVSNNIVLCESAIYPGSRKLPLIRYTGNNPKLPGHWHPNIRALRDMFESRGFSTEFIFEKRGRGGVVAQRV